MRILYFNAESDLEETAELLTERGYEVVSVTASHKALELIRTQPFDAVVIGDEREGPEVLDFTFKAHLTRPELPVFLSNDWGPELVAALNRLKRSGNPGKRHTDERAAIESACAPESGER
jgi:DNA-binding NtrC family response regulator